MSNILTLFNYVFYLQNQFPVEHPIRDTSWCFSYICSILLCPYLVPLLSLLKLPLFSVAAYKKFQQIK